MKLTGKQKEILKIFKDFPQEFLVKLDELSTDEYLVIKEQLEDTMLGKFLNNSNIRKIK